jgi:hypothetical protein
LHVKRRALPGSGGGREHGKLHLLLEQLTTQVVEWWSSVALCLKTAPLPLSFSLLFVVKKSSEVCTRILDSVVKIDFGLIPVWRKKFFFSVCKVFHGNVFVVMCIDFYLGKDSKGKNLRIYGISLGEKRKLEKWLSHCDLTLTLAVAS